MNYKEYKDFLKDEIKNRGKKVSSTKIDKINGVEKDVLIIRTDKNAEPIIYLDDMYASYKRGVNIEEQIDNIFKIVNQDSEEIQLMGLTLLNKSWEEIKEKVGVQVINYEWNKKKLKGVPFKQVLNLAIVFRVIFDEHSSSLITNRFLKKWGVTKEELIQVAFTNLENSKYTIKGISHLFGGCLDEELLSNGEDLLYVMTNESKVYGASAIARIDLLKGFAEKMEQDLYIIPSSIHEILLIPATDDVDVNYWKLRVKEVNRTEVKKEEWLSEDIYFFGRERNALMMAA